MRPAARVGAALGLALLAGPLGAATAAERAPAPTFERAVSLWQAGRLAEALLAFRAVAAASPDPATAATARGNVCFLEMDGGAFADALPDCQAALALYRSLGDELGQAQAENNLGLTLQGLGRMDEAAAAFRSALARNRRLGDALGEAMDLGNLGTLSTAQGRYSEALALDQQITALLARHAREPWAAGQSVVARINRGAVLEKLGAYREALALYRSLMAESASLDPRRRAELLVNSGVLYRNLGDPVAAVGSFDTAVAIFRRLGDRAALSNALLNRALALDQNLARPAEAESAYREALGLTQQGGDRTEEIQDLFYLGRFLLRQGRLDDAEASFTQGLAVAGKSGSAEGRWTCQEGLGRIARARGDLERALAHLTAALDEIERVRTALTTREHRAGYFGDKRPPYAAAVGVLAELDRQRPGQGFADRALEVAERAKARDLLDALPTAGKVAAPRPAEVLRARAGAGALLVYFLGEERLFGFRVTRTGVQLADLGPGEPILAAVAAVHGALAGGRPPAAAGLASLSRALLAPLGPLPAGRLLVVPDGLLHYLPFELLADPAAPGWTLLDRGPLTYLPSASTPEVPPPDNAGGRPRLAGFAAPRLPPAGAASTPQGLLLARFRLSPLPGAAGELERIAGRLGAPAGRGALFTGDRATEAAVRSALAANPRVAHFATHAVLDERPGRGAAILLTPAGGDDGLLGPEEIAGLAGRTDLTVLAACRSALGGPEEGSGDGRALQSLSGSFLAAGSAGVVATLWDVGDGNTAVFMDRLYAELARGYEPAEALWRTKLSFRADPRWRDPSLWAGYVLIGPGRPLAPDRRRVLAAIATLLLLAAAAALAAGGPGRRRATRPPAPRPSA